MELTPEQKATIEKWRTGGCEYPEQHSDHPEYWCNHCDGCGVCLGVRTA